MNFLYNVKVLTNGHSLRLSQYLTKTGVQRSNSMRHARVSINWQGVVYYTAARVKDHAPSIVKQQISKFC